MALCARGDQILFKSELVCYISQKENEKAVSFLSDIPSPQHLRNSPGNTLLHIAARYGNAFMTKHLLDIGSEIDARNKFNITPLALAVQYAHVETIAVLLDAKADVYDSSYRDCMLQTVHNYCMSRRPRIRTYKVIMELFSKKVYEDFRNSKLETGTKLWVGDCTLYLATLVARSSRVTRFYIKNGYDVNKPEPYTQRTALHAAVEGNDVLVVKLLVDHGADVNALDNTKQTPLCCYNFQRKDSTSKIEMLEYLIEHGASLTLENNVKCTPLEVLLTRGHTQTAAAVLRRVEDLTTKYRFGKTPLHFLASNTWQDVLTVLNGRTYDLEVRDDDGNTPLMITVLKNRNVSSLEFLIKNGADVNAENNGRTPLCHAVYNLRLDKKPLKVATQFCKLLLTAGANVQYVFKTFEDEKVVNDERTVFDYIVEFERFEVSMMFVAQLALDDELGESVTDLVRKKIEDNEILDEQFKDCKRQIEKMKEAKINESLTMFEMMTGKEMDHALSAIDFEFVSRLDELTNGFMQDNTYYLDIIKERVAAVAEKLKATKEFDESEVVSEPNKCCIS